MYPKGTIKLPICQQFSYYIYHYLLLDGIESSLLYRTVTTNEVYSYFNLDSEQKLLSFMKFIGEMAVVGIRRRKPKVNHEYALRINDAINMTSRIELFLSNSKLRLKLHAFKHKVGDVTQSHWLSGQLSGMVRHQNPEAAVRQLRLKAKFDCNNSMYKVTGANPDGKVRATCVWGDEKGAEIVFNNAAEVLDLVTKKRG